MDLDDLANVWRSSPPGQFLPSFASSFFSRTGAGAADRDLVADHEGDLAAEDIGHLVAVVMQMELRSRRCTV